MKPLRRLLERWLGSPSTYRWLARVGFGVVSLAGGVAWASGGGGHGDLHINWWTWDSHAPPLGWFVVDFLLFLGLLYFFAAKPVMAMFRKRHEVIKEGIESAQGELARARSHREEYQQKLSNVKQESEQLLEGAKRDGARERDQIIEATQQYSKQLRLDTQTAVDQEEDVARRRLRNEVVNDVLHYASDVLGKELTEEDQARLLEQAILELEEGSAVWPAAVSTGNGGEAMSRSVP